MQNKTKTRVRLFLVATGAMLALPLAAQTHSVSASEVCAEGHVGPQQLFPGCQNCPPGVSFGPTSQEPVFSIFVCVHP